MIEKKFMQISAKNRKILFHIDVIPLEFGTSRIDMSVYIRGERSKTES